MPSAKKAAPAKPSTAPKALPSSAPKKKSPPPPHKEHDHPKPPKPGKKHGGKHESGKDLRRAFEHLGRVQSLSSIKSSEPGAIPTLLELAQALIDAGNAESAADILRAAEHLAFAGLASTSSSRPKLTPDLEEAIRREFRKRAEKTEDHEPSRASALGRLALETLKQAQAAFTAKSFHAALEFARAAEALADIDIDDLPDNLLASLANVRALPAR